jgi:ABC-type nitrate/sulfonate/bicarbonate transport system substrate-binding protein
MIGTLKTLLAAIAALGLATGAANAQARTKMTIATGVDPAFSQFYVAKEAGLFEKNGLDVTINTGPSGSAMVPFLINNQIHAAYGSDLAGVINHNVDKNIVAVADGTYLVRWLSIVARGVPDMAALKGKRVAVSKGTGGEIFWNRVVDKLKLNPADYKIVDIEAPEMVAALERGDIDAFATWEPWPTRAIMGVKDAKIIQDAEGIYNNINFVYMNRSWIEKNEDTAVRFITALVEANDLIGKDRPAAAQMVSKFLKMPIELARELMPKVEYNMTLTDRAVSTIQISEETLKRQNKLPAPIDYSRYIYSDLLKKVRADNVKLTNLPK